MHRSASLQNKELMDLCEEEERELCFSRDEDSNSEEYELDSGGRGVRSSVSLEIHGLHREQQVHFSNREYYRRLEELKSTHLRNMAELERMYIGQGKEWHGEEEEEEEREQEKEGGVERERSGDARGCPSRTLQRINSQEELDLHETSSGSDQWELCGEDLQLANQRRSAGLDRTYRRNILISPVGTTTQKQFSFQPEAFRVKPPGRSSRPSGVRGHPGSKVTVPKPFQMMLREEDRKRQKVRTRSEMELENTLLRRKLDELQECQKKFRASPAPAHTHLPLYDIISRRTSLTFDRNSKTNPSSATISPRPLHFLDRERRKRERKMAAELGRSEEQPTFTVRPAPKSAYGTGHPKKSGSKATSKREATK